MSHYRTCNDTLLKTLTITVENLAPPQGSVLSQIWFGFHDGSFVTHEIGSPASSAIERMAEDGNSGPLTNEFSRSNAGIVQGTVFGSDDIFNSTFPGNKSSLKVAIDGSLSTSRYFSYAAMIIPSNDAFIANENSAAHQVFDEDGNFCDVEIIVAGSDVLDAGTEVNDEAPLHAAGAGPIFIFDTGVDENGMVSVHEGYKPGGTILSNPTWANANFKAGGYRVARITVSES